MIRKSDRKLAAPSKGQATYDYYCPIYCTDGDAAAATESSLSGHLVLPPSFLPSFLPRRIDDSWSQPQQHRFERRLRRFERADPRGSLPGSSDADVPNNIEKSVCTDVDKIHKQTDVDSGPTSSVAQEQQWSAAPQNNKATTNAKQHNTIFLYRNGHLLRLSNSIIWRNGHLLTCQIRLYARIVIFSIVIFKSLTRSESLWRSASSWLGLGHSFF
jgi:hypothetical protein